MAAVLSMMIVRVFNLVRTFAVPVPNNVFTYSVVQTTAWCNNHFGVEQRLCPAVEVRWIDMSPLF